MTPIIDPIHTPTRTPAHPPVRSTIAGLVLAAISAAVLAAAPAHAQQLPPQANHPAVKEAAAVCATDIQKHCAGVVPGGGRIVRCLAANEQSVTPDCKASIMKAKTALGL
ncbi:MAG: cysteine rich repeat-containing protein [Hyphomicrobiaceae bacterium]|nr:cysteine rich repeat-containing protein [Hyphomicrobiaceae bacterium]